MSLVVSEQVPLSGDQERADVYALLAELLLGPRPEVLHGLADLPRSQDDDGDLSVAWNALLDAAGPAALAEYGALFVAAGTPRLNPYECYYREGWLMDKPLARLRDDLRSLGLARAEHATELEDHLGALCETMRLLVASGQDGDVQRDFFARHLAGWTARCLQDMAAASGGGFYAALAGFIDVFFRHEAAGLGLEDETTVFHPPRTSRHVEVPS